MRLHLWKKFYDFMSFSGTPLRRRTFAGELNHQAGTFLPFVVVSGLPWLAYIPSDVQLHPGVPLILGLRVGLGAFGLMLPVLKLLPVFRARPLALLILFATYMELAAALIAGLTGGDPSYIGGYIFILTLMIVAPFPVTVTVGIVGASILTFFVTGVVHGLDLLQPVYLYSLKDLGSATLVTSMFAAILNNFRRSSWAKAQLVESQRRELQAERDKSDELLANILPLSIAAELKENAGVMPAHIPSATIVFVDIVNFSRIAQKLTPAVLIYELHDLFSGFDRIMDRYALEKLKTIGDCYMFAGGIPLPQDDHQFRAIRASLDILKFVKLHNDVDGGPGAVAGAVPDPARSLAWDVRIGIHTGPIVAGVVGEKKFVYDIWGDTVNIAKRLESAACPNRINISVDTAEAVASDFDLEYRGLVTVKNMEPMKMYFVKGPKGA
jgi:class 3 adenylate cyclase